MSGLGDLGGLPGFQSGMQVNPADIDLYQQFVYHNIGVGAGAIGTVTSATANPPFVIDNVQCDYPRNLLFTIAGVAGGMGGTAVVNGTDRWGNAIQETFAVGSANGGGSVSGTRIFSRVRSGTLTGIDGAGGTAIGTASIGYAIGTAAATKMWLGLPTRIGATSDVKMLTYIKNFVATPINGGTLTTANINITLHAIGGTEIAGSAHTYSVLYKSTYDNVGRAKQSNLA